MKILIKVSGDLINDCRVIRKIKMMARKNYTSVIHGAGTQISNALKSRGIPYKFIKGIRHTTGEGLKICFKESQKIGKGLKKKLKGKNIQIISPVSKEKEKIINRNAEEIFKEISTNFDKKIIFTISDREKPLLKNVKGIGIIKIKPIEENIMRP